MRVREYISPISGEVVLLIDKAGMPLSFPNRYAYSMIEKRGGSLSSIKKALYVFSRIYLWAAVRGVNLGQVLYYGEFLTSDQMSDLTDFIQFTSSSQNEILRHKQKFKKHPVDRSSVINFRNPSVQLRMLVGGITSP